MSKIRKIVSLAKSKGLITGIKELDNYFKRLKKLNDKQLDQLLEALQ